MLRRRLHDRMKALVDKALATYDPDALDAVIQQLREVLREHMQRVRQFGEVCRHARRRPLRPEL
jgi:hypothetical protein